MKKLMITSCNKGTKVGEISDQNINEAEYFFLHFTSSCTKAVNEKLEKKQYNYIIINCGQKYFLGIYRITRNDKVLKIEKLKEVIGENSVNFTKGLLEKIYDESKNKKGQTNELKYIDIEYEDELKFDALIKELEGCDFTYKKKKCSYADASNFKPAIKEAQRKFEEQGLSKLAQRSSYARRALGKNEPTFDRTEYQRDWERIVHSKAFRRLEDKAQIYTLAKGDHFRTRLTHTLEVTQIARGIARALDLNEDLTEAIALGHDLGHTPFGHVGERELDRILSEDHVHLEGESSQSLGGFKHNFQSIRIVDYLEEKYGEFQGLDLTYQVMEGILKHTKTYKCSNQQNCNDCTNKCYDINEFLKIGDVNELHLNYDFSTTLEGQAVAVADEIAQRAHDLDDGIASGIIKIGDFLDYIKSESIKKFHGKVKSKVRKQPEKKDNRNSLNLQEKKLFLKLNEDLEESKQCIAHDSRKYINSDDTLRAMVVSNVITFFIRSMKQYCKDNINNYIKELEQKGNVVDGNKEYVIEKSLIYFSDSLEKVRKKLENATSNKVINSEEVNCFDGKSAYIIRKLFKAFQTNPRQLPSSTLTRINREISKYTNDYIDIRKGPKDKVENEIKIYKGTDIVDEEQLLKHKIFTRCIVDLISGMTDEFANKQFNKLYIP